MTTLSPYLRRIFLAWSLLSLLVLGFWGPARPVALADSEDDYAPGEVVVKLNRTADLSGVAAQRELELVEHLLAKVVAPRSSLNGPLDANAVCRCLARYGATSRQR